MNTGNVYQSLQEIATFLLLIHDFYLKNAFGSDVLVALMTILRDSCLLDQVSLVEAERIRRQIMSTVDRQLGYEQFYEWLRGIGKVVYPMATHIGGKKELHLLLTTYILPNAVPAIQHQRTLQTSNLPYFTDSALESIVKYSDFLYFWFNHILNRQTIGLTNFTTKSCITWTSVCSGGSYHNGKVLVQHVIEALYDCGLVSSSTNGGSLCRSDDLDSILLLLESCNPLEGDHETKETVQKSSEDRHLDFNSFLYFLELVSERIAASVSVSIPPSGDRLTRLLQVAAEGMFHKAVARMVCTRPGYVEAAGIVTWLRQSGLGALDRVTIPWLYEQLTIYAEYSHADSTLSTVGHEWQTQQLPGTLAKVLQKVCGLHLNSFVTRDGSLGRKKGTDDDMQFLMRALPSLFFTGRFSLPTALCPLYNSLPVVQSAWRNLAVNVADGGCGFMEALVAASATKVDSTSSTGWQLRIAQLSELQTNCNEHWVSDIDCCCRYITVDTLLLFLSAAGEGEIPQQLVDGSFLASLCSQVGDTQPSLNNNQIHISLNSVVEVFFVFVYNYYGVVEAALGEDACDEQQQNEEDESDTQFVERVVRLVGRLWYFLVDRVRSPSSNANALPELNTSSTSSMGTERVPAQPTGHGQADYAVSHRTEPILHVASAIPSGQDEVKVVMSPPADAHSMREMSVLLAHFPLPSFSLNPWEVANLRTPYEETRDTRSVGDQSLTEMLSTFSLKYKVATDRLSTFFVQFYSGDDRSNVLSTNSVNHTEKKQALSSVTLERLMDSRTLRILYLNSDLLKWEFGRCLCRYRVAQDPFTDTLVFPFPVDQTAADLVEGEVDLAADTWLISAMLVPAMTALEWTASYGISRQMAVQQLAETTLLSGEMLGQYLTFSTFVVFAVRCFTAHVGRDRSVEVFVDEVRYMLHVFSQRLSAVQQTMRVRVLRLLFEVAENNADGTAIDRVLVSSLDLFDGHVSCSSAEIAKLPPRPPVAFWDSARFVEYCRMLGVLSGHEYSMELPWVAYGLCLKELVPRGVHLWDMNRVVPPVPLQIRENGVLQKLVCSMLLLAKTLDQSRRDSSGSNHDSDPLDCDLINPSLAEMSSKTIAPAVCMMVDRQLDGLLPASDAGSGPSLLLEDILRYGGSATMRSLSAAQSFLLMAYFSLCEQSRDGFASLLSDDYVQQEEDALQCEASLNLVCKFLARNSLLRVGSVAVQVKRSLHPRLRPIVHARATSTPAVTVSFAEFEELFVRCAFAQWEASGALLHPKHEPDLRLVTEMGGHFVGDTAQGKALVKQYLQECVNVRKDEADAVASRRGITNVKKSTWGVDFFGPFVVTAESFAEVTESALHQFRDSGILGDGRVQTSASFLSAADTSEALHKVVVSQDGPVRVQSRGDEVLMDIITSRLNYAVADPVNRSASEQRHESPNAATADMRRPSSTRSSTQRVTFTDQQQQNQRRELDGTSASSSPKTLLHTSQQVISSSSERVQLLQESSEQFVVALDALLVGTKEALWPVYATYCSCGDSLDPGKLSGPNLFTLLSKLGVLTDRTLLSDLGMLLHQISAHSFHTQAVRSVRPSLTFEEFLVFLCAFSQLRFDGVMVTAAMMDRVAPAATNSQQDNWYRRWQQFMSVSPSFRRLLSECILPVLKKRTLLAFPEDARLRDKFGFVFTAEVLAAVEGAERPLQRFFDSERARALEGVTKASTAPTEQIEVAGIIAAMRRLKLVPNVVPEEQVLQLIHDVLPEKPIKRSDPHDANIAADGRHELMLLFPQWEWVLCVVACQAVETAVQQSENFAATEKLPSLVADVITSIATAMTATDERRP